MKNLTATLATVLVLASLGVYVTLSIKAKQPHKEPQAQEAPAETIAPEIQKTAAKETQPAQEVKSAPQPQTVYVDRPYTPEPVQPVIINNTNIQNTPPIEPATTYAPAFTPPAPMTDKQIAEDILKLFNLTGTVEDTGTQIRIHLSTGQGVNQDKTAGWEEHLKSVIRKIK